MKKVLGMGNALVDIMTRLENDELLNSFSLPKGSMQLVDLPFIEKLGESTKELSKQQTSGGSAANTIHGLANLDIETGFIGKVGRDELGQFFKSDMIHCGIQPKLFESDSPTGRAMALVSPDSERTFATYLGAAVEISAGNLSVNLFTGYDYFHVEGYLVQDHNLIEIALKLAKETGLTVSLDLASYNVVENNLDFLKRIVEDYVDIVFANEEEAKAFTGKPPEKALNEMSEMSDIAIVKVGNKGSLIKRRKEIVKTGIIQAQSLDTTGAGDLYAAGFLYGLIHNLSIDKCGQVGALLAGKVIEIIGAKIPEKTWQEIRKQIN